MAITRTAMVDDDGSGTTGTILNNAWKQEFYNQIDAGLGTWTSVAFNAANFWTGVTAGHILTNRYLVVGKLLIWLMKISGAPGPATGYYLPLVLPAGLQVVADGVLSPVAYSSVAGALVVADHALLGQSKIGVQHPAAGLWPTPSTVYFTAIVAIQ